MPQGPTTAERRAEVQQVLSEGRWSAAEAARIAAKWGCSARTIENDRRRLAGVPQGSIPKRKPGAPKLHTLPPPAKGSGMPESAGRMLSKCTRAEALEWLLDQVGNAVQHGDPATGAFVAAAKECRAIIGELHEVRAADKAARPTGTPDKIAGEMAEKLKRLPAPVRKQIAAALAAG